MNDNRLAIDKRLAGIFADDLDRMTMIRFKYRARLSAIKLTRIQGTGTLDQEIQTAEEIVKFDNLANAITEILELQNG